MAIINARADNFYETKREEVSRGLAFIESCKTAIPDDVVWDVMFSESAKNQLKNNAKEYHDAIAKGDDAEAKKIFKLMTTRIQQRATKKAIEDDYAWGERMVFDAQSNMLGAISDEVGHHVHQDSSLDVDKTVNNCLDILENNPLESDSDESYLAQVFCLTLRFRGVDSHLNESTNGRIQKHIGNYQPMNYAEDFSKFFGKESRPTKNRGTAINPQVRSWEMSVRNILESVGGNFVPAPQ